ncbi:hypothetical protein R55227_BLOPHJLP_01595 [Fructobacillus tropaeoli]|uniref:hypothetical protein n=1 Tax=Fructobacillus tropaeoli TaxID=709323 RepID=UPI002DA68CEB|nr:hypothetical protein R55227_BLOPHJLP_01595 [Fructobacillus tropaeoli]
MKRTLKKLNKTVLFLVVLGLVALGTLQINGQRRAEIVSLNRQVQKQDYQVKKDVVKVEQIESHYQAGEQEAKNYLVRFAKSYYTFTNQADYVARFNQVKDFVKLDDEQKNKLFDNGEDASGGSKIENLGITSQYSSGKAYIGAKQDNRIEVFLLAKVLITSNGADDRNVQNLLHGWFNVTNGQLESLQVNQIQV